jgi:hypothetical protein
MVGGKEIRAWRQPCLDLGKGQALQTKRYLLILVSLGLCASAAADPIIVPTSLNPGDEYRLAFVTSEERNGASSNIASYNSFVTGVANTQSALTSLGTTWKAIGSTATVDARDNTGTNPVVDGVGVPIFLLNDTLLANDNLDLWDGSILVPFAIDEGDSAIPQSFVWTGTSSSGVARGSLALGAGVDSDVGIGLTAATSTSWVSGADLFKFLNRPVYALSDVLVVAVPAPLTRAQQACVNEMNKNGEKVNKAQLKENERCLRTFQTDKLVAPTFDVCTTADEKGRVDRAEERTETREAKKCVSPLPPFAYTDSATVNEAAVDGALALTYAIFGGPPVLDANLVTRAENRETAKCQLEMLKRADKLENIVLKEVNKAKKKAIKDESVDSAAALEAELWAVFSSNKRIQRTEDRLVRVVDRKCAVLQVPPSTVFPGACEERKNPNLREVEVCVIAAARCEACLKINDFDDLNMDCDLADDQVSNDSCP